MAVTFKSKLTAEPETIAYRIQCIVKAMLTRITGHIDAPMAKAKQLKHERLRAGVDRGSELLTVIMGMSESWPQRVVLHFNSWPVPAFQEHQ